jgi:predicted AAA+ superfamily ATPase
MVEININLNSSQDAQIKKDDELIQQDSKNRLIKIFKEYRNLLDNTNIDKLRVHNSILINGKRGFGKTTFILSMIELLKEEEKGIKDFYFFDIIDPTIIETKENIFIF